MNLPMMYRQENSLLGVFLNVMNKCSSTKTYVRYSKNLKQLVLPYLSIDVQGENYSLFNNSNS